MQCIPLSILVYPLSIHLDEFESMHINEQGIDNVLLCVCCFGSGVASRTGGASVTGAASVARVARVVSLATVAGVARVGPVAPGEAWA